MAHSEIKTAQNLATVVFGRFGRSEQAFSYVCGDHGNYEGHKVKIPDGRVIDPPCPQCHEQREAERAEQDRAEAAALRRSRNIERSGIPLRYQQKTFNDFIATCDGQRKALQTCKSYADDFVEIAKLGRCLIFSGGTGSGKTHLASAIANQIIREGRSATFTSVREVVAAVRATWRKNSSKSEEDVLAAFGSVDLLIIDEVGVQFDTDAERLVIFDVINRRYQDMMPSVVISNLPADAKEGQPSVRSTLGDRVLDRLRENGGTLIKFNWPSHRSLTTTNNS